MRFSMQRHVMLNPHRRVIGFEEFFGVGHRPGVTGVRDMPDGDSPEASAF